MRLEPGQVVLLPFPFTDLSSAKLRPALVLSAGPVNETSQDVIVCAVTSNVTDTEHSVYLRPEDVGPVALPRESRVKVAKVATLQKGIIRRVLGKVRPAVLGQVYREFFALFPSAS